MKNSIWYIGILALFLNIVAGLFISTYPLFNVILNCIVITMTTVLIWLSTHLRQRTAFAISLLFIYAIIGIIQFILGCFSTAIINDNWMIMTIMALLVIECILLIITKSISKKVK